MWYKAGHNSWLEVGVDNNQFYLQMHQRAEKFYTNFIDALDYTVKQITQDWSNKNFYLAFSGGSDSEVIADALVRNNITFTPVLINLGEINQYEYWYAEHWCWRNKITPVVFKWTVKDFYHNIIKLKDLSNIRSISGAAIVTLADYAKANDGVLLNGAADMNLKDGKFYCGDVDFTLDLARNGEHPTAVFMYNPEIALSYISQFDLSLCEQYNKMNFYSIPIRPKFNFWNELLYDNIKDPEVKNSPIFYIMEKKNLVINSIQPYWYGTKEEIIDKLLP